VKYAAKSSDKEVRRRVRHLEARNAHTVGIWGRGGVEHLVLCKYGSYIFPVPLTNYTFWVRRGYRRIFHISHFDLVD